MMQAREERGEFRGGQIGETAKVENTHKELR